jgi:hypothetical protein
MKKYCHSDVDILRRGLQEFRQLFINMTDVHTGKELGTDPLLYMTIAALAYDGVYRRHYLLPDTIKYVGRTKTRKLFSNLHRMDGTCHGYPKDFYPTCRE